MTSRSRKELSLGSLNGLLGMRPKLIHDSQLVVKSRICNRQPGFTPDWDPNSNDAGSALVDLFAQQFSAVAKRANRLPDKARLEYLNIAGVTSSFPKPATGIIRFEVSEAARQSVSIPQGFKVGANPANEEQELVIFETQDSLMATPAKIAVLQHQFNRDLTESNQPDGRFFPLGTNPQIGDSFLIGLEIPEMAAITGSLNIAIHIAEAPGEPEPVSSQSSTATSPLSATMRWQASYGGAFEDIQTRIDETNGLFRSGVLQLKLDQPLRASKLPDHEETLVWLRLQLVHGKFERAPELSFVELNAVRVAAVETIRDEVLIPEDPRKGQRFRLSRSPVNPNNTAIEIVSEESILTSDGLSEELQTRKWKVVENFDSAKDDDHVYTLDAERGLITFGDGVRGAKPPGGFRALRADRYQVLRGSASAVGKDEINVLLNAVQFVTSVSNTFAVSGGQDSNPLRSRVRRGPLRIRARDRSVARVDYGLTAEDAPGADVSRVHAIPGYHPRHRGKRIPGLVGLIVVSNRRERGRPVPDEPTLRAIGMHLVRAKKIPVGVEVVATAPRFRDLRAEIAFIPFDGDNLVERSTAIESRLNSFLDPISGGHTESGWPFGGRLSFSDLTNVLLTNALGRQTVRSISLRLFLDGILLPDCKDVEIGEDELFWPTGHQIVPAPSEVRR